jgi:NADH:ubiquinone oxidoreductase subunit 5 (subunit L)/multisubunit Na+/H+ antiporter MnhA subunit
LIVNRIGDFGFLIGLCFLFYLFRSVDFSVVFTLAAFFKDIKFTFFGLNVFYLDIICLFLFLGSMGKSAQIGLHT